MRFGKFSGGRIHRQRGMSRLGVLLFILLLVAGLYTSFQLIPIFYAFQEIEGFMEAQAKVATMHSDAKIRRFLLKKIKELDLTIDDEENLIIARFNGKIVIEMEYDEVFYVEWGDDFYYELWVFHLHPRVERPL